MSRFKIGQRVVAIVDHSRGSFKKGDEFIVDGFSCCERCGRPRINLKGINNILKTSCNTGCKHLGPYKRAEFAEHCFAPLQSFGEQIEEQLSKEANEVADWILEATQPKP